MPLFPSTHATQDRHQVISGIILDTVTDNATPVRVTIPTYGDRYWGPLPWMPRVDDDGRLVRPAAGDPCVVAMTLDRQPLGIVEWGDGAAVGSGLGWADVGVLQGNVGTLQVDVGGLLARLADADPVGRVEYIALTATPSGWLLCNGQKVTSSYPVLRAALIAASSPWGTDGPDPRVPNLVDRFIRGRSSLQTADDGADTVTLSVSQLPAHNHTVNSHTHSIAWQGGHGHAIRNPAWYDSMYFDYIGGGSSTKATLRPLTGGLAGWANPWVADTDGAHDHGGATGASAPSTTNTGNGSSHENRPLHKGLLPIIRAY